MGIPKKLLKLWREKREDVITTFRVLQELDIMKEDRVMSLMKDLDRFVAAEKRDSV